MAGNAAAAVDAYHDLLDTTSVLRTELLRLLFPKPFDVPFDLAQLANMSRAKEWFWGRLQWWPTAVPPGDFMEDIEQWMRVPIITPPCESIMHLKDLIIAAHGRASHALASLRSSQSALAVTCIAAERPTSWIPFRAEHSHVIFDDDFIKNGHA